MKFPLSSQEQLNRSAILWAVLSQSIWLPVFFFGSQDPWSSNQRDSSSSHHPQDLQALNRQLLLGSSKNFLHSRSSSSSPKLNGANESSGILLNSILTAQGSSLAGSVRSLTDKGSSQSLYTSPLTNNSSLGLNVSLPNRNHSQLARMFDSDRRPLSSATLIQKMYSRSELLGGTLTLQDLAEPEMPPIARAERAQWSRSGDPLAPLPEIWREPMRRALSDLAKDALTGKASSPGGPNQSLSLDPARFVHIPSSRIHRSSEIPLALQADGTVDILSKPEDPAVIDEIKQWSAKQKLPEQGKISPAVVHLHPLQPLSIGSSEEDRSFSNRPSPRRSTEAPIPSSTSVEVKSTSVVAPAYGQSGGPLLTTPLPATSSAAPEASTPPESGTITQAES